MDKESLRQRLGVISERLKAWFKSSLAEKVANASTVAEKIALAAKDASEVCT